MNDHLDGLPKPGDMVGDYRIVGLLGEGGHGHVYRAEAFGRSFAVKFMDPGLEKFGRREVQALMEFRHPGVVGFVACGRWRDPERGLFYVVMELVEGKTLYDYVMEYNPSARKVGQMMLALGRTLLAVEEAGVLHRDVKLENIMVRLPSQEPVLLDFGLATLRGARSSGGSGGVTGTLEYLSPEAWKHMRDRGEEDEEEEEERYRPTAKDEQWALGVTFYWMLADVLPFGERADSFLMMMRRVLRVQPKAPHLINPRVPPELSAICMRMLKKNPEERYANLREMCGELRRGLEASPGEASWEVPLGQPDAPECRTTQIDERILAAKGIELEIAKLWRPRRGRVRRRREVRVPAEAPAELPAEAAPLPLAQPVPLPGAAPVVAAPSPEPVQRAPSPEGGRKGIVTALMLASMGMPVNWSKLRSAARWAAALTVLLALGFVVGPTLCPTPSSLSERTHVLPSAQGPLLVWAPAPGLLEESAVLPPQLPGELLPAEEASRLDAWQVGNWHQKLAPSLHSHEAVPGAALTPASVAEAMLPQEEPDVKTPVKKARLGPLKRTVAAAAAAMALGCPAPQVRPPPEPMDCPPGALENMEKLGIKRGKSGSFEFESYRSWEKRDPERIAEYFPVKEGWTSFKAIEGWDTKPLIMRLSGKVIFGSDRAYGRLTQATLSDGTTLRVCMELFDYEDLKRGLKCEPTSSPDTVKAGSLVKVRPVDHFE